MAIHMALRVNDDLTDDPIAFGGSAPTSAAPRPLGRQASRGQAVVAPLHAVRPASGTGGATGSTGAPQRRAVSRRVSSVGRPAGAVAGYRPRVSPAACASDEWDVPYRMGRWARLAMTMVVTAALIVGAVTLVGWSSPPEVKQVTAQPGDTLLALVLREMPHAAPLDAMDRVIELNDLRPGQPLVGLVLDIPVE